MPKDEAAELNRVGLILVEDDNVDAAWRLEAAFYWEQTFPPGQEIVVEHRYRPVVGFSFFGDYVFADTAKAAKYCMDCELREGRQGQARIGEECADALSRREAHLLHPHHRQQLVGPDRLLPPRRRQGQS